MTRINWHVMKGKAYTGYWTYVFGLGMVFWILLSLPSCDQFQSNNQDIPVAKVFDSYLYKSELAKQIDGDLSPEDSAEMAKSYIQRWIDRQLLLRMAETHLTEADKNVNMELEDYRAKLLIYKYEQQWIKENLDTVIDTMQIREYYEAYTSNFILDNAIIKGMYIKVSNVSPDISNLNYWIRSEDHENRQEIMDYCKDYASEFRVFEDKWMSLQPFLAEMDHEIDNPEEYLRYRSYLHVQDDQYHYYIKINDKRLRGDVAPLEYVSDDIRLILLNKRKIQQINQLENNIYNDALNRDQVKIFEKQGN